MPRSFSRGSAPSPPRLVPSGASFTSVILIPVSSFAQVGPHSHLIVAGLAGPPQRRARQPRSDDYCDYLIPAAEQTLAPAIAQMAEAESNLSATTVDSMFDLFTHTGVSSDAGSVMLELAGSTVVPFSRAAGGVWPASRMMAR